MVNQKSSDVSELFLCFRDVNDCRKSNSAVFKNLISGHSCGIPKMISRQAVLLLLSVV